MLVNKDITYWLGEEVDTQNLLGKFNDINDYQSNKQRMRLRWTRGKNPQMEWRSDLGRGKWELMRQIEGFIEKRIGQPFSKVYSEFIDKFDTNQMLGWMSIKGRFESMFASTKYNKGESVATTRSWYSQYYIDDCGLIQPIPRTSFKRYKPLYAITGEYEYKVNTEWVEYYKGIMMEVGGANIYVQLMNNPPKKWMETELIQEIRKISLKWMETHPETFKRYHNWDSPEPTTPGYYGGDPAEHLYKCMVDTKQLYVTCEVEPGTIEYKDTLNEIKKIRKQIKAKKKRTGMGEYYDSILKAKKHQKNE